MLRQLRQHIVQHLWETYRCSSPDMQRIETVLKQKGIRKQILDHFAVIDLPGPHSGIPQLREIFSGLGYVEQGKDYLADKQNDFLWMTEANCLSFPAIDVLPQVVVADFRLDEMPFEIRGIIEKYSSRAQHFPLDQMQKLINRITENEADEFNLCADIILRYLSGRDWPLPTIKEFYTVQEFNELLAWVLVFGRRPNHFTLSIHLLDHFADLEAFHRFVEEEAKLPLNSEGGKLKGGKANGIAQGSTSGIAQPVELADGTIEIPTGFIEFVWRYPKDPAKPRPEYWNEYFTGFIAQHADRVIESLYT